MSDELIKVIVDEVIRTLDGEELLEMPRDPDINVLIVKKIDENVKKAIEIWQTVKFETKGD